MSEPVSDVLMFAFFQLRQHCFPSQAPTSDLQGFWGVMGCTCWAAWLLALLVIFIQFGGSVLVICGGRWAWLGAGALGVFTALATLLAHSWWTKTGIDGFHDFNTFWEHVGLIGGLMLAAVPGTDGQKINEVSITCRVSALGFWRTKIVPRN